MVTTTLQARSGADVHVRPVAAGDARALQQFNAGLSEGSRGLFLPHRYDSATLTEIIARAERGEDRTYLALAEDAVAGYFFLWEFQAPVPILGIGLADRWQGQGLGTQFMDILIQDAKATGRDGIELTTVPGNERAITLYRKLGFAHLRDADNIAGDGRTVREHVMFLALKPDAQPPDRDFKPPA